MTALRAAPVLLAALLLQLTLFVDVRIIGVAPELPALFAALSGLFGGAHRGSAAAFVSGLAWDVYLPTPLGLSALSFALVAYAIGAATEELFHDSWPQTTMVAFIGTAASVSLYAVLGEVVGQRGLLDDDLVLVVALASAMNAVIALAAARPVRWALGTLDASTFRPRAVAAGR